MNARKGVGFVAWLDRAGNLSISDLAVSGWTFVESGKLLGSWEAAAVASDAFPAASQVSALRISYYARTGEAKGSFKLSWPESGKTVNANVKLSGVVVSGRLYAMASARNLGTFKVTTSH